jgi:hypothetical protein
VTATLTAGYQLTEMYRSRVRQQQDMAVIVSDYHNRRGTGKTVLSLKLAAAMDRTEEGLTEEKVSLSPADLAEAYVDLPKGQRWCLMRPRLACRSTALAVLRTWPCASWSAWAGCDRST